MKKFKLCEQFLNLIKFRIQIRQVFPFLCLGLAFIMNGCSPSGKLAFEFELGPKGLSSGGLTLLKTDNSLVVKNSEGGDKPFIEFPLRSAFISAGVGEPEVQYKMASFKFKDRLAKKCDSQKILGAEKTEKGFLLKGKLFGTNCLTDFNLKLEIISKNEMEFRLTLSDEKINRVYLKYNSSPEERFLGFGEQFSHSDMKGRKPFLFTEEQGIGRGDQPITFGANLMAGAGGNEYTTYIPIPHYITTDNRSLFLENSTYMKFDLKKNNEVTLEVWDSNITGSIFLGNSPLELIEMFSKKTGRFDALPDWAYGTWLGLQGGKDKVKKIVQDAKKSGNPVTALWIQDWCGRRITKFGSQLKWRWHEDTSLYPDFKNFVAELNKENVKVLGYINSFLADKDPSKPDDDFENPMLEEAKKKGYLVKDKNGNDYRIETAGFPAYLIDLTNPEAVKWTKEIIKKNMIEKGLSGWMADFGEWLPFDAKLHSGISAEKYHNIYPVDWARVNREAIREAGKEGQIVFFTRAGYSYSARYSTLFWEGDQMVSFGKHDGLPSTIIGLTSGGISGIALNHSDIGGYTTINNPLKNYHRSKELFFRWSELNAFTPIFRTHEGNRPEKNHQPYTDSETIEKFSRYGKIHYALRDYFAYLANEAKEKGYPVIRHTYLHYPDEKETLKHVYQFMVGEDMLVVPVIKPGANQVKGYFPKGNWTDVWTGKKIEGGKVIQVEGPLGKPPVFVKEGGAWSEKIRSAISGI